MPPDLEGWKAIGKGRERKLAGFVHGLRNAS
jgi:hypothetical protein